MASLDDLTAAAIERTGLDDFGDDSFREGLEILVRALADEARLNARGKAFIYDRIGLHLCQRLQVEDWYRRHPEIDDEPIVAPLFGLGLPRTGSTALSFLWHAIHTSATYAVGSRPGRVRRRRQWQVTIRESHRRRDPSSSAPGTTYPTTSRGRWSASI